MALDTHHLEEAAQAFVKLQRRADRLGGNLDFPDDLRKHLSSANFAVATLYSLGKDRLRELESSGNIHRSTVDGGSLSTAMFFLSKYMNSIENNFSRDVYEQLSRTCRSARDLYDKGLV